MSLIRWFFSLAFISMFTVSSAWANTVATATVNRTTVNKDEVFQLKVAVNTRASNNAVDFSVLQSNFYMGRPSFSSAQRYINGRSSVSSEWTVALAATKTGILTIPSFEIEGAKTAPIAIQVTNNTQGRTQDDIIQFTASLDKDELYEGERTQLHARLIIKADLRRLQNTNIESAFGEGLSIEPKGESNQYQSVIDGVEATVVDQSFYVIPERAGQLTVHPPRLTGALVERARNGGTRLIQLDKSAPAMALKVNAKPDSYQGAWLPTPSLSLDQLWQDEDGERINATTLSARVGTPIQRTLVLRAKNLSQQQLPNLKIDYPDQIRVYDEAPKFSQGKDGDIIMTLKQVLIAKEAGEFTLPEVNIRWWDSINGEERTSTASSMNIMVEQGDAIAVSPMIQPEIPVETITVTDRGIWPYLTAGFATLWLITLALLVKAKRTSKPALNEKVSRKSSGSEADLLRAISSRDGITFDRAFNVWKQTYQADEALLAEAENFRASLFGRNKSSFDEKVLVSAIKSANPLNSGKESSALASL
ncbi:BatD family protein [Vibrio nigripulchritudo]|nr:BatD family protein [Vibrio nigripulchritudo]